MGKITRRSSALQRESRKSVWQSCHDLSLVRRFCGGEFRRSILGRSRGTIPARGRTRSALTADVELFDERLVTRFIFLLQEVQKRTAVRDELQKTAA